MKGARIKINLLSGFGKLFKVMTKKDTKIYYITVQAQSVYQS